MHFQRQSRARSLVCEPYRRRDQSVVDTLGLVRPAKCDRTSTLPRCEPHTGHVRFCQCGWHRAVPYPWPQSHHLQALVHTSWEAWVSTLVSVGALPGCLPRRRLLSECFPYLADRGLRERAAYTTCSPVSRSAQDVLDHPSCSTRY